MSVEWTYARRASLRAFCDCIFPSLRVEPDPYGSWGRKASDFAVDMAVEATLERSVAEPIRRGLIGLLDAFHASGLTEVAPESGEQLIRTIASSSPEAAAGVLGLERLVLSLCYALPDAQGENPNWPALGYPGPRRQAASLDRRIVPLVVDCDELTLEADVCIVGSGAGGGVVAGELSKRGLRVVVLEAGNYYTEAEFTQLELWAFQNLYWRGGYTPTADNNVSLIAGATLGGGTTVNWQNCVRTPDWIREEWARQHGLEGLDGTDFTAHLDGVLARIQANDRCSDLNGPHQRLEDAARRLGYSFRRCMRNVDPTRYDAEVAGFQGYGDITGSRMSTLNTYLDDAYRAGARILVRTRAERIVTKGGRAVGVAATGTGPGGERYAVLVHAPQVVVACGALETPALLARSGIGGPAVGDYLRLHPVVSLSGVYADDQRAWWGPPQSGMSDEFLRLDDDHGFLIECAHHSYVVAATAFPWRSGREHKELMAAAPRYAMFIAIVRDRGHGRVSIDENGESRPIYPLQDALDIAHMQRGLCELARMHEAAGAERILGLARNDLQVWRRGDDLEGFLRETGALAESWAPQRVFSAHQMGSARMGTRPETSVAKPTGELHDTRGVWIGDSSAFPTAPGVNPMVTCMALASRTASMLAETARRA